MKLNKFKTKEFRKIYALIDDKNRINAIMATPETFMKSANASDGWRWEKLSDLPVAKFVKTNELLVKSDD